MHRHPSDFDFSSSFAIIPPTTQGLKSSPPVCEFVKMSRGQTLRALVNERLAAAAEEIFVLFERTIAEYEEELCRCKNVTQVLGPGIELISEKYQIPWTNPGPSMNQEITGTPLIKEEPEEQRVKQEEEQLPVQFPESSFLCVKTEESSLLQQRKTEHQEEPQLNSETEELTDHSSDTDNDEKQEPLSYSAAQMETEADGDHENQVQTKERITKLFPQNKSAPETSVHSGGAKRKENLCPFCNKSFTSKGNLQKHYRLHTGEKPFSCLICKQTFAQKGTLDKHQRTHTGERPFSCRICEKTFTQKSSLYQHQRVHTGERPYSCSVCEKAFTQKSSLDMHKRIHSEDRPYSCLVCMKTFNLKSTLNKHKVIHTGERPFSCTVCEKTFSHRSTLNTHKRVHAQRDLTVSQSV